MSKSGGWSAALFGAGGSVDEMTPLISQQAKLQESKDDKTLIALTKKISVMASGVTRSFR